MSDSVAIITIDYDEGNQSSYRSVIIKNSSTTYKGKPLCFEFSSKDVVRDFASAIEFATESKFEHIMFSSSVTHFVMDGEDYKCDLVNGKETIVRI